MPTNFPIIKTLGKVLLRNSLQSLQRFSFYLLNRVKTVSPERSLEFAALLQIPIWVSAWDCMGIDGNPWERVGNNKVPCRNPCESAWEKLSAWWPIKEAIRGCIGCNSPYRKPQGRPYRTTWVNKTHVGSYMGQCGANVSAWWLIDETILDSIGWNYPHKNPRGRPCGTTWVNEPHTGSHMGLYGNP